MEVKLISENEFRNTDSEHILNIPFSSVYSYIHGGIKKVLSIKVWHPVESLRSLW